jgi:hypothetical protein
MVKAGLVVIATLVVVGWVVPGRVGGDVRWLG